MAFTAHLSSRSASARDQWAARTLAFAAYLSAFAFAARNLA
jgi:hypothetical protein